jgi:hypothetical protein
VTGEERTALLVLISGRFRVELPAAASSWSNRGTTSCGAAVSTTRGGAEEESVVLTVRRPSVPGYAVDADDASADEPSS